MSDVVFYEDGTVALNATVEKESIWLSQKQIAELFGVQRPAVTKYLTNIFKSGELDEEVVSSILEHSTQHGAKNVHCKFGQNHSNQKFSLEKYLFEDKI